LGFYQCDERKSPSKNPTPKYRIKKQIDQDLSETQTIKEVFRQLTKALHPDREMDEKEKK
jgi:hypothetical protein